MKNFASKNDLALAKIFTIYKNFDNCALVNYSFCIAPFLIMEYIQATYIYVVFTHSENLPSKNFDNCALLNYSFCIAPYLIMEYIHTSYMQLSLIAKIYHLRILTTVHFLTTLSVQPLYLIMEYIQVICSCHSQRVYTRYVVTYCNYVQYGNMVC